MTTNQDFERLSAYVDNQLPPAERAALEGRLAAEPELRATLRELRLTVQALRSMPAVKLPRSFTLTPDQVGAAGYQPQRRAGWFPVLRFATALSALALVVVLAGDLGGGMLATSTSAGGGEPEVALLAATQTEDDFVPAEAPAPSETAVSLETMGVGVEETTEADGTDPDASAGDLTQEMSLLAPEAAPTQTLEAMADRTVAPTDEGGTKGLDATPTPEVIANVPPSVTEDVYYDAGESGAIEQTQIAAPGPSGLSPVRVIEIALAMLTVLLGVTVWLTRRSP